MWARFHCLGWELKLHLQPYTFLKGQAWLTCVSLESLTLTYVHNSVLGIFSLLVFQVHVCAELVLNNV